jgi:hypothetical protein
MGIPNRQIGWSTKSNLLWQISKQLERLICITAGGCSTTTTTTTVACISTEWQYTITAEDVENATGNTGEVITINVPNPLEVTAYDEFGGFYISNCPSGYSGGGFAFNSGQIGTYTLCSVNEPYIWYFHNNEAVFLTVTDTLTPC